MQRDARAVEDIALAHVSTGHDTQEVKWLMAMLVMSACSFRLTAGTSDVVDAAEGGSPGIDAADDAVDAVDAAPSCQVGVASLTGTDRGRVGGTGGGVNFPPLECAPTERIVGVALRMSDQDTLYNGRSAHGFRIACASVTFDGTGTPQVGTVTMREIVGSGTFDWSPSTLTPITQCQPGWAVGGLRAHRGSGSNRFLDVSILCRQLGVNGTTAMTEVRYVTGSLTDGVNPNTVNCATTEILVRVPSMTGSGIDSVNLSCSTPTCS